MTQEGMAEHIKLDHLALGLEVVGAVVLLVALVNLGRSLTPLPTPVAHGELRLGGLYRGAGDGNPALGARALRHAKEQHQHQGDHKERERGQRHNGQLPVIDDRGNEERNQPCQGEGRLAHGVIAEFGFDAAEVARLREGRVVA